MFRRAKVECTNDSLFVNGSNVDEQTSKSTIDSLLHAKGKTKGGKDKYRINPATGKKVATTTEFYYDQGLFFRWYDYDSMRLSVGIKLYRDIDSKEWRLKTKGTGTGLRSISIKQSELVAR